VTAGGVLHQNDRFLSIMKIGYSINEALIRGLKQHIPLFLGFAAARHKGNITEPSFW
jgi:hypothetical protein